MSTLNTPVAGGSGGAAGVEVALPRARTAGRPAFTWVLENERLLAAVLLAPTVVLLGLFIAYPFVMGIWLSLSSVSVGRPGQFVGLANFVKAWNDSIFRTAFYNTFFYTFWATVFKLGGPPCCCRSSSPPYSRRSPGGGCSTRPSAC